jgi:hypothetical protein
MALGHLPNDFPGLLVLAASHVAAQFKWVCVRTAKIDNGEHTACEGPKIVLDFVGLA